MGANGMGKSTLLDLMAGRRQPTEGRIEVGPTVALGLLRPAGHDPGPGPAGARRRHRWGPGAGLARRRAARAVLVQRRHPVRAHRPALGRRASPVAAAVDPGRPTQRAAARRAHQRPGRRHPAGAGGVPGGLARGAGGGQPRPGLPGADRGRRGGAGRIGRGRAPTRRLRGLGGRASGEPALRPRGESRPTRARPPPRRPRGLADGRPLRRRRGARSARCARPSARPRRTWPASSASGTGSPNRSSRPATTTRSWPGWGPSWPPSGPRSRRSNTGGWSCPPRPRRRRADRYHRRVLFEAKFAAGHRRGVGHAHLPPMEAVPGGGRPHLPHRCRAAHGGGRGRGGGGRHHRSRCPPGRVRIRRRAAGRSARLAGSARLPGPLPPGRRPRSPRPAGGHGRAGRRAGGRDRSAPGSTGSSQLVGSLDRGHPPG